MAASCLSVRDICFNQSRSYAKALKRRAVRVFLNKKDACPKTDHVKSKIKQCAKKADTPSGRGPAIVDLNVKLKTQASAGVVSSLCNSVQAAAQCQFEMIRPGDTRFGPVIAEAKSLPARRVKGLILLEGKRLVHEAVLTDQELKSVFFTQFEALDGLPIQALVNRGVKLYKVKADHMQVWSDTVTPQGLMAICKMPKTSVEKSASFETIPVTLICDGILDHGVLGTLVRSAVAAGCSKILVTRGCVDAWEPKVLRSGAGSHFRAPSLVTELSWEMVGNYLSSDMQSFLVSPQSSVKTMMANTSNCKSHRFSKQSKAVASLPIVSLEEVRCPGGVEIAVVVTDSPGVDALRLISESRGSLLQLPINGEVGLLNSAALGSVTLFEFARQLRPSAQLRTSSTVRTDGP